MTGDKRVDGMTDSMDLSLSKLREMVKEMVKARCSPRGCNELDTIA